MKSMNEYVPFLSKSRFIRGMQCHKALWLQTHRPKLKEETPPERQAIFDTGHEVGILAQQLFPGGVEVPFDGVSLSDQIEQTRRLIESGADTIYEAAFSHDNIFVKADILHRTENGWNIGEVKSATRAKDVYVNDVAVQYHVITGSGVPVSSVGLVLIDTSYVRNGDIEPHKLFKWVDVTDRVRAIQEAIVTEAEAQREMLCGSEPVMVIGPHCSDPYECDFANHCWQHIPSPSVFDFADLGKPDPFDLYRQGIHRMEDVPLSSLKWRQQLQLKGLLNKNQVIDTGAVRSFLDGLWYPLCFLDFETTYMTPVPLFDGTRPYQQVPFQFSLHILEKPGAELRHQEFLAPVGERPQMAFLQSLLASVPKDACILTWNQVFEKGRLKELAAHCPDQSEEIASIMKNIRDLMAPFRRKDIYHWQFNGSYSIKAVLPALAPELSYHELAVSNGEMAASTWLRMHHESNEEQLEEMRQQLLEYCHLDTFAMVKILEKMHELAS